MFLAACTMSSTEWLPEIYETTDVDALLGEWRLTEIKGITNHFTAVEIQVTREVGGRFIQMMREPENPKENTFTNPSELRFYRIGTNLYAMSISAEPTDSPHTIDKYKNIYRILQEENGQSMTVLSVSDQSAVQDIRDGKINGSIDRLDSHSPEFCTITATSSELAEYLTSADFREFLVFSKIEAPIKAMNE